MSAVSCKHRRHQGALPSLVYFYEADHDAVIESLQPPIGMPNTYAPVVSGQFIKKRLDAITVG